MVNPTQEDLEQLTALADEAIFGTTNPELD